MHPHSRIIRLRARGFNHILYRNSGLKPALCRPDADEANRASVAQNSTVSRFRPVSACSTACSSVHSSVHSYLRSKTGSS
jgi:hypothetical protein